MLVCNIFWSIVIISRWKFLTIICFVDCLQNTIGTKDNIDFHRMSLLSSPSWCVWCGAVWSTDADLRTTATLYGRRADRDRDLDVDGRGRAPPQCPRYLIRANPRYYNIRPPSAIIYLSSIYHLFTIYLSDLRLVHIARGRKREGRKRAIMFDFGRRLWEAAGVIDAFASRMRDVTSTDMHIFRGNYLIFLKSLSPTQ